MMGRFLSVRFDYRLKCPVDRSGQMVKFQLGPRTLDVISCTATPENIECGKLCRGDTEIQEYWCWAALSLNK